MRSLWALALLAVARAEDAEPAAEAPADEETEAYGIMKDVEITMVSQVIDGTSFMIKDKKNKPVTVQIGTLKSGSGSAEKLSGLLQRSMILYRAFPDDKQPGDGSVHADVWTAEGLHIGMHLAEKGHAESTGVTTDYTKNILQVAAEADKQKSYKQLEEALAEQAKFEKDAADEMKAEHEFELAKTKDPMLVMSVLFVAALIVVPVYMKRQQGSDQDRRNKMAAARAKAAQKAAGKGA
jgi:hypothetical protein